MSDKERAAQLRAEADVMQQSDPARSTNLRAAADEIDPPQTEEPRKPAKKAAKKKGKR